MDIRPSTYSGSWYPATSGECEGEIGTFLRNQPSPFPPRGEYRCAIVPHAGWFFSGNIACNAISLLRGDAPPDVIAVLGMHLHPDSEPVIMNRGAWQTPLGPLAVHEELAAAMEKNFRMSVETARHPGDNTIELQLPFIKYFFGNARILPMGTPPADIALKIGRVLVHEADRLGLAIRIIGSTDLTHYGPNYGFSPAGSGEEALRWVEEENDKRAIDAITEMDPERIITQGLTLKNSCCAGAAAATVSAARAMGIERGHAAGYTTSRQRHHDESFVGYCGVVF